MKYRNLRIAWSVAWGIVALLLIVLWVRSYSQTGYLERQSPPSFFIHSQRGQLTYMSGLPERFILGLLSGKTHFDPALTSSPPVWGFGESRSGGSIRLLFLPYWSVVLITSVVAAISWFRWRFTLRTLLLAMALLAILLGLAAHFLTGPPASLPVDYISPPDL